MYCDIYTCTLLFIAHSECITKYFAHSSRGDTSGVLFWETLQSMEVNRIPMCLPPIWEEEVLIFILYRSTGWRWGMDKKRLDPIKVCGHTFLK